MKTNFIIISLVFLFACRNSKNLGNDKIKDEFLKHLNILDSGAKIYSGSTISCCSNSIAFMIENTNVKIHSKATFHGFLFFTREDLVQFHKYYKEKVK